MPLGNGSGSHLPNVAAEAAEALALATTAQYCRGHSSLPAVRLSGCWLQCSRACIRHVFEHGIPEDEMPSAAGNTAALAHSGSDKAAAGRNSGHKSGNISGRFSCVQYCRSCSISLPTRLSANPASAANRSSAAAHELSMHGGSWRIRLRQSAAATRTAAQNRFNRTGSLRIHCSTPPTEAAQLRIFPSRGRVRLGAFSLMNILSRCSRIDGISRGCPPAQCFSMRQSVDCQGH